jgi:surface antigen
MRYVRYYDRLKLRLGRKSARKRAIRVGFVSFNLVIVAVILFFVLFNPKASSQSSLGITNSETSAVAINPLDQVSSADIALTVAQVNNLSESNAVANQAQSAAADVAMAATTDNLITKPQVVTTALKSKADIQDYVTAPGDTVASLATKFGITSNSIMWSNGLTGNTLTLGTKLVIPPVNGIVYTVKPGDTSTSLATKYNANSSLITAYNDAEINGLTPGEQIIIPNATLSSSSSSNYVASASSGGSSSFPWGNGPVYGGSNGYDYGYCTWYVATQIPVPSNWGNASTWAFYAGLSGWNVSFKPTVGAIAQTPFAAGGEGHVAVVDAVSPDGSQVQIRDMNGIAGWGRVGYSGWIPTTKFLNYITP